MSNNTKGILGILACIVFIVGSIQSCMHNHKWIEATCTEPRTCSSCNKTEGIPLGHQWQEATCQTPKTCSVCGETSGSPKRHDWTGASCTAPKTCSSCGATKGEALGHTLYQLDWFTFKRPTCQSEGFCSNTCRRCGNTEIRSIPVVSCVAGSWQTIKDNSTSGILIKARYCIMCGKEMEQEAVTLSSTSGDVGNSGTSSSTGGSSNFNTYDNESQQETTASYVLNTSSRKFHYPSCRSVKKISPSNYSTSSGSRDDLIALGYDPCGICHP